MNFRVREWLQNAGITWGWVDIAPNARKRFHMAEAYSASKNVARHVGKRCFAKAPISTISLNKQTKKQKNNVSDSTHDLP
jgi:hypothetical protein